MRGFSRSSELQDALDALNEIEELSKRGDLQRALDMFVGAFHRFGHLSDPAFQEQFSGIAKELGPVANSLPYRERPTHGGAGAGSDDEDTEPGWPATSLESFIETLTDDEDRKIFQHIGTLHLNIPLPCFVN